MSAFDVYAEVVRSMLRMAEKELARGDVAAARDSIKYAQVQLDYTMQIVENKASGEVATV